MRHLLNALYIFILILISPIILWRAITKGRYRRGWLERLFGLCPRVCDQPSRSGHDDSESVRELTIWLHAVSVGELQVIRPIVEQYERCHPNYRLCISTSTDSGMDLAKRLYAKHAVFFTPFDFTWAIKNCLNRLGADQIILAELEIWPNWLSIAHARGLRISIVNARLSESSFRGYQRLGSIMKSMLKNIDWIGCQTETYRDRFVALGMDHSRTSVTGNIKFDGATGDRNHPEVQQRRKYLGLTENDIVWLAGSTQHPEEDMVLDAFIKLRGSYPTLKLVLVPRHAERFNEVAESIVKTGIAFARRSTHKTDLASDQWQIFLGDSVGELRWWWGLADVGFVGGSFGDRGGQNMIEPCAYGVATSFGPNTKNFSDIVRLLLDAQAAQQMQSPEELTTWTASILASPERRKTIAGKAMDVTRQHRGAVVATWNHLEEMHSK